jgi:hypothetical protein
MKNREQLLDNLTNAAKEIHTSGINAFSMGSDYTGWGRCALISMIQRKYIGYDVTCVDAEINNIADFNNTSELDLLVGAIGRFDPHASGNALNDQDEWSSRTIEQLVCEDYRNITIYSWENGTQWRLADSSSNPNPCIRDAARPLAVSERQLFIGESVDDIKSMIDASLDKASSLADVPEYALAAQRMFDLKVFGAIISDHTLANSYKFFPASSITPKLKKFLTYSVGGGRDAQGGFVALVLVHDDADAAKENVSLLEQRINNTLQQSGELDELIHDITIWREDKVIISKIYTNSETLWVMLDDYGLLIHQE